MKVYRSAIAIFCQDYREEINGMHTLVGIMSDNMSVPHLPGALDKVIVYVRSMFSIESPPKAISVRLTFPWEDPDFFQPTADEVLIAQSLKDAKDHGSPAVTFVTRIASSPFLVKGPGRVEVIVSFDEDEYLAGHLNIELKS